MHIPDRAAPGGPGDERSAAARRLRAVLLAAIAMLVTVVPTLLVGGWVLLGLWFHDGGTLGGPGAAADDHYEPGTWSAVLGIAVVATAVLIVAMAGYVTYRRSLGPEPAAEN